MLNTITELNNMGFSLTAENDNIRLEHIASGGYEYSRVKELLDILRAHKQEALDILKNDCSYAFVPVQLDNDPFAQTQAAACSDDITPPLTEISGGQAPAESTHSSRTEFLAVLAAVLTEKGKTEMIPVFNRRLSAPLEIGVEYPVMVRYQGSTYMLKSYDTLEKYAESGGVRFRHYNLFGILTMIFVR